MLGHSNRRSRERRSVFSRNFEDTNVDEVQDPVHDHLRLIRSPLGMKTETQLRKRTRSEISLTTKIVVTRLAAQPEAHSRACFFAQPTLAPTTKAPLSAPAAPSNCCPTRPPSNGPPPPSTAPVLLVLLRTTAVTTTSRPSFD